MIKRIALVLALVTTLALVAAPVALADENEAGWWGNVVGYPFPGSQICLTALDGSMLNNCHSQDPLRPYEIVKFDGIPPKAYMVKSGPATAFVFAKPGVDNWIDWAWSVPGWWHHPMPMPPSPAWHMWQPGGGMSMSGPPMTNVEVEQNVNMTGTGSVSQSVSVKSAGSTSVKVNQNVNVTAPAPKSVGKAAPKVICFCYTVKAGDSLSKIAVRFHDTVKGLAARNHITNPSKIRVGQKLTVCDP